MLPSDCSAPELSSMSSVSFAVWPLSDANRKLPSLSMEVAASIAPTDWILPALLVEMLAASSVSRPCDNRVLLLENAPLKAKVAAPHDWICPALLSHNARIFMVPARIPPPLTRTEERRIGQERRST